MLNWAYDVSSLKEIEFLSQEEQSDLVQKLNFALYMETKKSALLQKDWKDIIPISKISARKSILGINTRSNMKNFEFNLTNSQLSSEYKLYLSAIINSVESSLAEPMLTDTTLSTVETTPKGKFVLLLYGFTLVTRQDYFFVLLFAFNFFALEINFFFFSSNHHSANKTSQRHQFALLCQNL